MKTRTIPQKSYRYDVLLTVSGWGLAIFVSLLYLHDDDTSAVAQKAANPIEQTVEHRSDRVEGLLNESLVLVSRNRPAEAIQRITMLWSVCHTTHQEVPEQSHRVFAQAVSMMSNNSSPRHPEPVARNAEGEPDSLAAPLERAESPYERKKPGSDTTTKRPALTIATPDYPRAKNDSYPKDAPKEKSSSSIPSPCDEGPERQSAQLPPPPPHTNERHNRRYPGPRTSNNSRLPSNPPPHPGNPGEQWRRTPPPLHRSDARVGRRDPLNAGTGGPPPGYLNY